MHHLLALEACEGGVEQGAQQLAHPVGAEVEAEHPVPVLHALIIADYGGVDEFVALVMGVGVSHHRQRIGEARRLRAHQQIIGP